MITHKSSAVGHTRSSMNGKGDSHMDEKALFALLKAFKPKMHVTKKHQIRKGLHCPLTLIGKTFSVNCTDADDYEHVAEKLNLDLDLALRFVRAADCSLAELANRKDEKLLRRQLFKVLGLPKNKL